MDFFFSLTLYLMCRTGKRTESKTAHKRRTGQPYSLFAEMMDGTGPCVTGRNVDMPKLHVFHRGGRILERVTRPWFGHDTLVDVLG